MTRAIQSKQMEFGEIDISKININTKSRDDIPAILLGLQYIYSNKDTRNIIFELLERNISPNVDKSNGRPGMELWKIFVIGVLRVGLNYDYDRLEDLVNNHNTIRQMLGHGDISKNDTYNVQTLKDNVSLLTPELLNEINVIIVQSGHSLLTGKKKEEKLRVRCDSFVCETDVHYPTDISLLFDAVRKVIQIITNLADRNDITDWRQSKHNIKLLKKLTRIAQKKKRVSARSEKHKEQRDKDIKDAHQELITKAEKYLNKAKNILEIVSKNGSLNAIDMAMIKEIHHYSDHTERQVNQITRRVIQGETIPHNEKVFSVFQEHTEWISKGKAGVPVELGLRVCIVEDQHQFILGHRVMQKETDDQVAVAIIQEVKEHFPDLYSCSYDKGFHSPANQEALKDELEAVGLPRKGKLSKKAKEEEQSEDFLKARHKHSAVESAINALESGGLDRCLDHGIHGYKRYVGLAALARNLHRAGDLIKKKIAKGKKRKPDKNIFLKAA